MQTPSGVSNAIQRCACSIISSAVSVTVSIALDNTVVGNSSILPFYRIAMRSITWLEIK